MRRLILITVMLFVTTLVANAQYTFTDTSATYAPLNDSLSTSLTDTGLWDEAIFYIPIGFNYTFGNGSYDSLYISTNALITFFQACDSFPQAAPQLMPFAIDLTDKGNFLNPDTPYSDIRYQVTGNTGNRIFKLEWSNAGFWNASIDDSLSFQVWLYENADIVEYHFGPGNISDSSVFLVPPLCTIIDKADCDTTYSGRVIYGDPDNPNDTFLDQSLIYTFNDYVMYSLQWIPSNGTVYRFERHTTALQQEARKETLQIFPNPASGDFLQISTNLNSHENATVEVLDVSGKILLEERLSGDNTQMDISKLSPGVYFIQLKQNKQVHIKRFIKK